MALASSSQQLVYQGRVTRPDGTVINSGNLTFTLSLYSPAPSQCLLYQETQVVPMGGSAGMFSLKFGAGSRVDGGAHSFNQAFVNGATLSGLTCSSGTSYVASATDDRNLVVSFNDSGTVVNLSAMAIKSVPFALQAHEIDGWGLNNIVKVSTLGSPTTFTIAEMANAKAIAGAACASGEVLKWNGTAWACASDITTGAATDAGYTASNKGIVAFDTNAATSGITVTSGVASVNAGTGNNQIVKLDGSAKLPGVDGSALTNLDPIHLSAAVAINKGGTGQITAILGFNALSPITTKGDLITSDGTNNIRLPAGTNGYVLTADSAHSSGIKWAPVTAGTVTSVSSANSDIAVATGTSTPVLTLNSGTGANQIVKLDGSAKLPAVDGSALTNLNAGNISSGTLPISRGGTAATSFGANAVIVSNGTGSALQALNCTSGQVVTFDASGYAICGAATGATGFVNGGNSFGASAILGTRDNNDLYIRTHDDTRMAILKTGEIGIGTSTPGSPLELNASSTITSGSSIANKQFLDVGPAAASTANYYNQYYTTDLSTNKALTSVYGIYNEVTKTAGSPTYVYVQNNSFTTSNSFGTATISQVYGTRNDLSVSRSGMTTTNMTGTYNNLAAYLGTITNAYGSYNTIATSGGTITNGYGAYIGAIGATNKWSLYAADASAPSFFAGKVGMGSTSPAAVLDISGSAGTTLKIVDGNQGAGKVLTSDANGVASWAAPLATGISGTAGKIAKFSSGTAVGDSLLTETTGQVSVAGQINSTGSADQTSNSPNIDFNKGNSLFVTANCTAFALSNMVSGGNYSFAVQGTSGTCTFTHGSDTVHYAGGVSGAPITSHTIFGLVKYGTHVYVTWVTF